jgi:hypothetical protein
MTRLVLVRALIAAVLAAASAGCTLRQACDAENPCSDGESCVDFFCTAAAPDAGVPNKDDAGFVDVDAGFADAGFDDVDAGFDDVDAGFADAGFADAGFPDAGFPDVDAGTVISVFVDDFDRAVTGGWGDIAGTPFSWRVNANAAALLVADGAGVIDTSLSGETFTGAIVQEAGVDDLFIGLALEGTVRALYKGDGRAGRLDFLVQIHRTDNGRYELDIQFEDDALIVHIDRRTGPASAAEETMTELFSVPGDFHDRDVDFSFGFSTVLQEYLAVVTPAGGDPIVVTLPAPTEPYLPTAGVIQVATAVTGDVVVRVDRIELLDIE